MSTFTIDADNNITAYVSDEEANQSEVAGLVHFDSQATLAKVSADWPMSRFVEIWNGIPGQTPVKKFQDRSREAGCSVQSREAGQEGQGREGGPPQADRRKGFRSQ